MQTWREGLGYKHAHGLLADSTSVAIPAAPRVPLSNIKPPVCAPTALRAPALCGGLSVCLHVPTSHTLPSRQMCNPLLSATRASGPAASRRQNST